MNKLIDVHRLVLIDTTHSIYFLIKIFKCENCSDWLWRIFHNIIFFIDLHLNLKKKREREIEILIDLNNFFFLVLEELFG